MLQKNLIKKIIGFNIMDTAIFLFLVAGGYITGRKPPIVEIGSEINVEDFINPIPSGLILTGIVVAVSVTALMLTLCMKLYEHYGTLNMDVIPLVRDRRDD